MNELLSQISKGLHPLGSLHLSTSSLLPATNPTQNGLVCPQTHSPLDLPLPLLLTPTSAPAPSHSCPPSGPRGSPTSSKGFRDNSALRKWFNIITRLIICTMRVNPLYYWVCPTWFVVSACVFFLPPQLESSSQELNHPQHLAKRSAGHSRAGQACTCRLLDTWGSLTLLPFSSKRRLESIHACTPPSPLRIFLFSLFPDLHTCVDSST